MKPKALPPLWSWDLPVALVLVGASIWLAVGFWYPDPKLIGPGTSSLIPVLLWILRLGTPAAGLLLAAGYIALRRNCFPLVPVLLISTGLAAAFLLLFPVVSHFYYNRGFAAVVENYHPYLQLTPPLYEGSDQPEKIFRIFCLGGSTTEFKDSQGHGWPTRVQKLLAGVGLPQSVEVTNLGRQWYTSQHTLYNYVSNLRQHRPNVIVVMHAINDLVQNAEFGVFASGQPFREDYGNFYGPVYRLIKRKSLFRSVSDIVDSAWYFQPRIIVDTDVFPGLGPFERNLNTLLDLAKLDQTAVVLMTQPNLYKAKLAPAEKSVLYIPFSEAIGRDRRWSVDTVRIGLSAYNDTVRRIAQQRSVKLIDLEPAVPKTLQMFTDDVHYTEAGFDRVAAVVGRELAELLQSQQDRAQPIQDQAPAAS